MFPIDDTGAAVAALGEGSPTVCGASPAAAIAGSDEGSLACAAESGRGDPADDCASCSSAPPSPSTRFPSSSSSSSSRGDSSTSSLLLSAGSSPADAASSRSGSSTAVSGSGPDACDAGSERPVELSSDMIAGHYHRTLGRTSRSNTERGQHLAPFIRRYVGHGGGALGRKGTRTVDNSGALIEVCTNYYCKATAVD